MVTKEIHGSHDHVACAYSSRKEENGSQQKSYFVGFQLHRWDPTFNLTDVIQKSSCTPSSFKAQLIVPPTQVVHHSCR